jgi:phenylalanine-4-hydroxylase
MLFCVASPLRVRRSHHPLTQRRATVQMRLSFLDVPVPEARVWEALTDDQRAVVIDLLARLFVNALEAPPDE